MNMEMKGDSSMNDSFKPYIPAERSIPELTLFSVLMGIILAVIFGVVNAYLGLKVGMTISASIPAAVVSMSITRVILKRESILENNMIQTIASAGESLTAGAIFTIPALFLFFKSSNMGLPSILLMTLIGLCGGVLGVMFMIPLRRALIVKEHDTLPYPEGGACANVLLAGEEGGGQARATFEGLFLGGIYKFIADGFAVFKSQITTQIVAPFRTAIGIDAMPALLGVGFIIGKQVASFMFAGSLMGWLLIIPVLTLVGDQSHLILFPATIPISQMTPEEIWQNYIRYIGAGAVAFGGLISFFKSMPMIAETFLESLKNYNELIQGKVHIRTDRDVPLSTVITVIVFVGLAICLMPTLNIGWVGGIFVIVFGFFFATVSSRIVGIIGSSSNPVSGMTLATLIIASFIYRLLGHTNEQGVVSVLVVGSIVCIIIAMAGDTSQDLKTGYLVGATPFKQQVGELIGVISISVVLSGILLLFDRAWGFGSPELPAPQATLVKLVVEGVLYGDLPWALIILGGAIGLIVEILGLPVLPVAIGLYLPINLTSTVFIGGLMKGFFAKHLDQSGEMSHDKMDKGILFASGLIAGEGLIGVVLALMAVGGVSMALPWHMGSMGTILCFLFVVALMLKRCLFSPSDENERL